MKLERRAPLHLVIQICYGFLKKIEIVSLLMYTLTPSLQYSPPFFEKKSALSCQKQPVTTNPMIFKSGKVYDTLTPLKLCCALRYLQPPLPSEKLTTKLVFVLTLFFIYPEKIYTQRVKRKCTLKTDCFSKIIISKFQEQLKLFQFWNLIPIPRIITKHCFFVSGLSL